MYDQIRKWLKAGGSLPDDDALCNELPIVKYAYDAQGRLKLETKDKVKERIGKSPDYADSLALTFAQPVNIFSRFRRMAGKARRLFANTDYDFGV